LGEADVERRCTALEYLDPEAASNGLDRDLCRCRSAQNNLNEFSGFETKLRAGLRPGSRLGPAPEALAAPRRHVGAFVPIRLNVVLTDMECDEGRSMLVRAIQLQIALVLILLLALAGCATTPGQGSQPQNLPPVGAPPTDPSGPPQTQPGGSGISVGDRAQSALEAMVMGAVLGSTFGPIGMAAGAGTMLIYGALTGNVPFQTAGIGGGGRRDPGGAEAQREAELEAEIENEMARGENLESEIESELLRQEELLQQIEEQEKIQESATAAIAPSISDDELSERIDPRAAPKPPSDRDLPMAIFDEERATIPKNGWDNPKKLQVVKRSLDADRDGNPEQVRYFDEKTGQMIRKEQDRDFDGRSDTWSVYEDGELVSRKLDSNSDGKIDVWESYAGGRMSSRQIDRDNDGVKDAFYVYEGDALLEERHDSDNDGTMDLIVTYRKRQRVGSEEDTDHDGQMDTWTSYQVVRDEEAISRIERDTDADGTRDVFETYEAAKGRPQLTKREEDKDGDGQVDVISIYENGKLVRREISDPNLVPL
jgi:hypothetical protein